MRGRLIALAGLAMLAAGCGARSHKDDPTDTVIGGDQACGRKPAFVPLHSDAKVILCSANRSDSSGKDSGTIIYTSAAAPAAVLAASKAAAVKAGLAEQLATPETFSASEGDKRTLMVMTAAQGSGSQVTLSWSRQR